MQHSASWQSGFILSVNYIECHKLPPYAESHYTECHYADCRYAECRGAVYLDDRKEKPTKPQEKEKKLFCPKSQHYNSQGLLLQNTADL
jgi:hypothetical protein